MTKNDFNTEKNKSQGLYPSFSSEPAVDVYQQDLIDSVKYSKVIKKLRAFFEGKGFIETPTQPRLSILAACEDPTTVQTFDYMQSIWPLPQTGQMWLEYELLTKPKEAGFFCISTSYRHEPNPVPGRHKVIFPMFEFELPGDINTLKNLELELLEFLGIAKRDEVKEVLYTEMAKSFGVNELSSVEEQKMFETMGRAQLLTLFPIHTSPFWNMKQENGVAQKIDVIIAGQETIGSAERSSDAKQMYDSFHTISDGMYAELLYRLFTKERVDRELNSFLSLNFFPRVGGGIGVTRLIRAMEMFNLI